MIKPKYPYITIQISDADGNAFAILARCRRALVDAGAPSEEISAFLSEASSGNYAHLISAVSRWFACT